MADLFVPLRGTLSIKPERWEEQFVYQRDGYTIYILGNVREENGIPESKVSELFKGVEDRRVVHRFFLDVSGDYCIYIENESSVRVCPCYSYPLLYLSTEEYHGERTIRLSDSEVLGLSSGFDYERLFLRTLASHGYLIPRGVGAAVDDFVIPGMELFINKSNLISSFSWILPISEFAEDYDHNKASSKIAEAVVDEVSKFKSSENIEAPLTLQLSSGVDSGLLLAGCMAAGVDATPVNFRQSDSLDESVGAKLLTNYFGLKLKELYRGPTEGDETFTEQTNIKGYLDYSKPLLETGSGMIILDNVSLLAPYHFNYHTSIEGSAYPTSLCIGHHTRYPKSRTKGGLFFDPLGNSEVRHTYSIEYAQSLVDQSPVDDFWEISKNWPEIDSYYWRYLNPCFSNGFEGQLISKHLPAFTEKDLSCALVKRALINRGNQIIGKMLCEPFLREGMKKADPQVAMKLQKLIVTILKPFWTNTRNYNYKKANIFDQVRPGSSSQVLMAMLKVGVDNKLTSYPKWHVFQAFKMLSGKDFFSINRRQPFIHAYHAKKHRVKKAFGIDSSKTRVKDIIRENREVIRLINENRSHEKYDHILSSFSEEEKELITRTTSSPPAKVSSFHNFLNLSFLYNQSGNL